MPHQELFASTGMTVAGRSLVSVNTNVRDKTVGFFASGTISTLMTAASAAFYIPFNMEVRAIQVAMGISAANNITLTLVQYNNVMKASTTMLANANTIMVPGLKAVGSDTGTFNTGTLFLGSFLGYQVMSTGAAGFGENMTITVMVRTS